jgi:hypothetical protein
MAVYCDIIIPVAQAWGPGKSSDTGETFISQFKAIDVDLAGYSVICNQGLTLRSVRNKHDTGEFFCPLDPPVGVERKKFSQQLGGLMNRSCEEDLSFSEVTDTWSGGSRQLDESDHKILQKS